MADRINAGYAVFCGVDVGKSDHHACALDPAGKRVWDRPLPNDELALTAMLADLQTHGRVLVVVDQPASIGALVIAVARSLGIDVGYLPGLAMRRIADLHPGQAKTDARDAYVIADAARTMPHTLRRVGTDDHTLAELGVLAGYDDDLAADITRMTNRLRDALLHIHPALERLLGNHFDRGGVLDLLAAAPTPAALAALGVDRIGELMTAGSPRLAKTLPTKIVAALGQQTVTVPGTDAFGRVIAGVAAQLRQVRRQRAELAEELEAKLEAHPLAQHRPRALPPDHRQPDRLPNIEASVTRTVPQAEDTEPSATWVTWTEHVALGSQVGAATIVDPGRRIHGEMLAFSRGVNGTETDRRPRSRSGRGIHPGRRPSS